MTAAAEGSTSAAHRELALEALRSVADADGFVPFDHFMEVALYAPGVGFYARDDSPFGREGDYYTAAHASPLFGRTIAERVRTVLAVLPTDRPRRVIEVGPGDGTLAEGVLRGLAAGPTSFGPVEYVLVERSGPLSVRSFERVASVGQAVGIPVRAARGIGADGPFYGVVLANELLDAQPARRLLWDGTRWLETGVRLTREGFAPATTPLERPVPGTKLPESPPLGTILEFSPMAEAFVREVADHLVAGLCILLDYGMDETELLSAHPGGTLAAVRRHRYVDDPFADPGSSDLSVFVNFTRVRAVASASGLREVAFRSQAEALGAWGFPHLFEEALRSAPNAEAEVRTRLAGKSLLFGFERFYALELAPPERSRAPVT
ncbi:MAG TPA: SAM-dependent methyltransferase [Thermoplasmata archaeon]|nr:SAM-dependent methyltransferase [Thermoplasmata archaeon]